MTREEEIKALSQEPTSEMVHVETLRQVMWERDIAIEQLHELGYELGQKIEPCDDAISREAVIKAVDAHTNEDGTLDDDISVILEELPSVTQTPKYWIDKDNKLYKMPDDIPQKSEKWIALVTRPMTNEEREYYSEQLDYCDGDAVIYDCPLPEEGQDVLITTCTGGVLIDTFFNDYDGCGFEGYDIEDVKAWMPLPKPYEPQESEE